jgi:hypothetical protein
MLTVADVETLIAAARAQERGAVLRAWQAGRRNPQSIQSNPIPL